MKNDSYVRYIFYKYKKDPNQTFSFNEELKSSLEMKNYVKDNLDICYRPHMTIREQG